MTYRLYGDLGSGAFSAEAALAEAGAPYEFELISLDKGEQKEPRFLSLNPSGKIPALRLPEGEIVTESSIEGADIKRSLMRAARSSAISA